MANHQQPQNNPSKPAFVLGNGRSRLAININDLLPKGITFACNAIYREASVDHLIAVDVKMVNEIVSAGYNQNHTVWTNPNKGILNTTNLNFFDPHKGWSSGPTALWLAATMGHREIYILGFDFEGIEGKFNNVYADTFNYKNSWEVPTFYGNWVTQTERVIKDFPSTTFYRLVGNKKYFTPPALADQRNLIHMNYDTLATNFGLTLQKS